MANHPRTGLYLWVTVVSTLCTYLIEAVLSSENVVVNVTVGEQASLYCRLPSTVSITGLDWFKVLDEKSKHYLSIYEWRRIDGSSHKGVINQEVSHKMDTVNRTRLRINNTDIYDSGSYRCEVAYPSMVAVSRHFQLNVFHLKNLTTSATTDSQTTIPWMDWAQDYDDKNADDQTSYIVFGVLSIIVVCVFVVIAVTYTIYSHKRPGGKIKRPIISGESEDPALVMAPLIHSAARTDGMGGGLTAAKTDGMGGLPEENRVGDLRTAGQASTFEHPCAEDIIAQIRKRYETDYKDMGSDDVNMNLEFAIISNKLQVYNQNPVTSWEEFFKDAKDDEKTQKIVVFSQDELPLCKIIAFQWATNSNAILCPEYDVTILLKLHGHSLSDCIVNMIVNDIVPDQRGKEELVNDLLNTHTGKVLFLVEGFDQMDQNKPGTDEPLFTLEQLLQDGGHHVLITSDPAAYEKVKTFANFTIQGREDLKLLCDKLKFYIPELRVFGVKRIYPKDKVVLVLITQNVSCESSIQNKLRTILTKTELEKVTVKRMESVNE